MPTHNRVELLKKAIDSVLSQTYQNFQLIVVNDGSSDGTKAFLDSLDDERIHVIHNEKAQGACLSRNAAIKALQTELVTGLDDDDVFLPNRLEQLLSVYDDKWAFVCSGYYWDYGAHKKALFKNDRGISLSDAFDLNQCSNQILVNRERLLNVGCFDENIPALQDHDLWVRLIAEYGDAFRTGVPSYIVNDDHSLERISSVNNKLNAITLFEEKHAHLMSKRNKENFVFYRAKINSEPFSLGKYCSSLKYGLLGLKSRHYLAQYFKTASKLRLRYLQTGKVSQPNKNESLSNYLLPLLATGGPGASRIILLSACIFFLGAAESSSFSSDFFILMLLNTAFSQSYGFFLLKPEFENNYAAITKQSSLGLAGSLVVGGGLYYLNVLSELWLNLALIVILHFYYLYRFKNISSQNFKPLAVAEVCISISCFILPLLASYVLENTSKVPYQIYILGSLVGLFCVVFMSPKDNPNRATTIKIPMKKVRNIAISTTASIFAVFILPTAIKSIAQPEIVSIVALTISCMSVSMLIPRTYANKIMKQLGGAGLSAKNYQHLSLSYFRLIFISALGGLLITMLYLRLIGGSIDGVLFFVPLAVAAILVSAQQGFISLTFLSLQGADQKVAKMNAIVLAITGACSIPLMMQWVNTNLFIIVIVMVACLSFIGRNYIAKRNTRTYLKMDK